MNSGETGDQISPLPFFLRERSTEFVRTEPTNCACPTGHDAGASSAQRSAWRPALGRAPVEAAHVSGVIRMETTILMPRFGVFYFFIRGPCFYATEDGRRRNSPMSVDFTAAKGSNAGD